MRAGAIFASANGLVLLGRLDEARSRFAAAERVADASGDLEVLGWVFFASVFRAFVSGDTGSVVDQGRRAVEIAEQLDNELLGLSGTLLSAWRIRSTAKTPRPGTPYAKAPPPRLAVPPSNPG